jgi:hypothetical protein
MLLLKIRHRFHSLRKIYVICGNLFWNHERNGAISAVSAISAIKSITANTSRVMQPAYGIHNLRNLRFIFYFRHTDTISTQNPCGAQSTGWNATDR